MAIKYEMTTASHVMTVVASGSDDDLDEVQKYGLAIIEKAKQSGCHKILCNELQLEYRLNTLDTFEAAAFISRHAPSVGRVAIACDPRFIKDAQFWETVAVNRGTVVRVFPDLAEATKWLEGV